MFAVHRKPQTLIPSKYTRYIYGTYTDQLSKMNKVSGLVSFILRNTLICSWYTV